MEWTYYKSIVKNVKKITTLAVALQIFDKTKSQSFFNHKKAYASITEESSEYLRNH